MGLIATNTSMANPIEFRHLNAMPNISLGTDTQLQKATSRPMLPAGQLRR